MSRKKEWLTTAQEMEARLRVMREGNRRLEDHPMDLSIVRTLSSILMDRGDPANELLRQIRGTGALVGVPDAVSTADVAFSKTAEEDALAGLAVASLGHQLSEIVDRIDGALREKQRCSRAHVTAGFAFTDAVRRAAQELPD